MDGTKLVHQSRLDWTFVSITTIGEDTSVAAFYCSTCTDLRMLSLLLIFVCCCQHTLVVAQTEEYFVSHGGGGDEYAPALVEVSDGYITAGETFSYGSQDYIIQKVDFDGNHVWTKTHVNGGNGEQHNECIEATDATGILCAGWSNTYSGQECTLLKLDYSGDMLFAYRYGGSVCYDVAQHPSTLKIALFGISTGGPGGYDAFMVQTTAAGVKEWGYSWGGTAGDFGHAGILSSDGNWVCAGPHSSAALSNGGDDVLMVKVDDTGSTVWAYSYGSPLAEYAGVGALIEYSIDNSLIVVGSSTSVLGAGSTDALLMSVDQSGTLLWAQIYGGVSADSAMDVVESLLYGGFGVVLKAHALDPENIAFVKLSGSGALEWGLKIGGDATAEVPMGLLETAGTGGGWIVTGNTGSTGYTSGGVDQFYWKIGPTGTSNCATTITTGLTIVNVMPDFARVDAVAAGIVRTATGIVQTAIGVGTGTSRVPTLTTVCAKQTVPSVSPSQSETNTPSQTASSSTTPTQTRTSSNTATPSGTPSNSPTASQTASQTSSPSISPSQTPSQSLSPTQSPTLTTSSSASSSAIAAQCPAQHHCPDASRCQASSNSTMGYFCDCSAMRPYSFGVFCNLTVSEFKQSATQRSCSGCDTLFVCAQDTTVDVQTLLETLPLSLSRVVCGCVNPSAALQARFLVVQTVLDGENRACAEITIASPFNNDASNSTSASKLVTLLSQSDQVDGVLSIETARPSTLPECLDAEGCLGNQSNGGSDSLLYVVIASCALMALFILLVIWYFIHRRVRQQYKVQQAARIHADSNTIKVQETVSVRI